MKTVFMIFGCLYFLVVGTEVLHAQGVENFSVAEDSCDTNQLSLDLGFGFPKSGAIEILFPMPNTHARTPKRYPADKVVCIDLSELVNLERSLGYTDEGMPIYEAVFYLTYDPVGSLTYTRSRFDYDILICDELPETPLPPAELKFGTFHWSVASGIKAQKVSWIRDLRADLEAACRD